MQIRKYTDCSIVQICTIDLVVDSNSNYLQFWEAAFHHIQCMSGLVTTGLGFLLRLCCCPGEVKVTVSPSPARLIPDTLRYSANNFSSPSVNSQFNFDSTVTKDVG